MAKLQATKTVNPLHFEDLDPHRFEDMVRQLAYDFRPWSRVEATGRTGADDGIDIRAIESEPAEETASELGNAAPALERVWVFQVKREQHLGPSDMRKIVKDAAPRGGILPYGLVLAAACNFTKRAMDAYHDEAKKVGVSVSLL